MPEWYPWTTGVAGRRHYPHPGGCHRESANSALAGAAGWMARSTAPAAPRSCTNWTRFAARSGAAPRERGGDCGGQSAGAVRVSRGGTGLPRRPARRAGTAGVVLPHVPGDGRRARVRTISFPAISTGVYGYPMEEAARIAVGVVVAHFARPEVRLERPSSWCLGRRRTRRTGRRWRPDRNSHAREAGGTRRGENLGTDGSVHAASRNSALLWEMACALGRSRQSPRFRGVASGRRTA